MSVKPNLGIIGIGNWGRNLIRDFSKYGKITKCTNNGNSKNISWVKKNYPSIEYVKNQKEILNDEKINAVIISTPIKTHYSLIKKVLLSKKHVFVEKPLCTNVSDAKELIQIAKRNNLHLFVGHVFLHHEVFKKIIQINKNENIKSIHFQWNKYGTFDEDIFLNLLSHDLSLIISLFGTPTKIQLQNNVGFITESDFIYLNLHFKRKSSSIMINRFSSYKKKTVTIKTSKNSYHWDDDVLFKTRRNEKLQKIFKSKTTSLENECKNFVKSISLSKISYESANLAKDVIQVIKNLK